MTPGADAAAPLHEVVEALTEALEARLDGAVALVLTNNRRRLLSYRKRFYSAEVRVSRRLLALGPMVVCPIVDFVVEKPRAREELKVLFELVPEAPVRKRNRPAMQAQGDTYDLERILMQESMHAFGEKVTLPITWGPRRAMRRRQRSIRLGAYDFERQLIRIHRRLDDPSVPEWFVGFVVFHELLHHRFGVERRAGRRVIHSAAFRAAEQRHPCYRAARHWEATNLHRLLKRSPRVRGTR